MLKCMIYLDFLKVEIFFLFVCYASKCTLQAPAAPGFFFSLSPTIQKQNIESFWHGFKTNCNCVANRLAL